MNHKFITNQLNPTGAKFMEISSKVLATKHMHLKFVKEKASNDELKKMNLSPQENI